MADTHEEQLLNDVLGDLRAADEPLGAARLEARVMAEWEDRFGAAKVRLKPDPTYSFPTYGYRYGVAVAAAMVMALTGSLLFDRENGPLPTVASPSLTIASAIAPLAIPEAVPPITRSPITQSPIAPRPHITQSPITQSTIEFVPLTPLTRHDLAGPFQIVRVQMPRASLGALAPPDSPNPFVEADLLLGEDGMARAIRVSSVQSSLPWRSR